MENESLYAAGVDPTIARLGLNQVNIFTCHLAKGIEFKQNLIQNEAFIFVDFNFEN